MAGQPYEKKHFVHNEWSRPFFADAVTVTGAGPGRLIFLSGMGPEEENGPAGNIRASGDFTAQCRYSFEKIARALKRHEASMHDVVKIVGYLTDPRRVFDYAACLTEAFGDAPLPAHTLVTVSALAFPEMLVEIDVTAVAQQ